MDSLTQAAFGAGVAAVCVPAGHRRKALVVGAALGTLPDLDVLIDYGDAVSNFTYHRGFSHSLFVLPPVAVALWWLLRRIWQPVAAAPRAWLLALLLALVTHPLLDAHTAYGTQLLWPLTSPPVSWSTLFIIDPLFTLPLLVGLVAVAIRPRASRVLPVAIGLSLAYLGWSWTAKTIVESRVDDALAAKGIPAQAVFSVPAPFNTLLWRVVVLTDDGYLEGFDSLLIDGDHTSFDAYSFDRQLLEPLPGVPAIARLRWFSSDFLRAGVEGQQLVITDLRMGQEPKYVFRFAVARQADDGWEPITPVQLPTLITRDDVRGVFQRLTAP